MNELPANDPLGHDLLEARIDSAEASLLKRADEPAPRIDAAGCRHWLVGGVGSSEAHARAFISLVNRSSPGSASFVWPTEPGESQRRDDGIGWLYFSQGFSNNAVGATRHWLSSDAIPRVLVTAATVASLEQSGHLDRANHLRQLMESGTILVPMEGLSEYTILIRTIGPLCGFMVAIQLAAAVGATVSIPDSGRIKAIQAAAKETWSTDRLALRDEWIELAGLNTVGPFADCIQNLTLKRLEGIYRDPSPTRDLLAYAHGSFQREVLCQRPQWVLCDAETAGHPLVERFQVMNTSAGIRSRILESPYGFPESLFYFEMLLNRVLLGAVRHLRIDQVNWPGRGMDTKLYGWDKGW